MQKYKLGKHEVRVCGKAVETDAGIELVHSASFIEFYGEIGKVSMKISGNADESDFAAYVGVFLNEGDTPETVWKIQDGLHHYEICWTSEKKNTVVKVMKLTEMQYGAVQIHSVDTDGNIKPTEPKERKLLFIGDSITAGYGVNGGSQILFYNKDGRCDKSISLPDSKGSIGRSMVCLLEWGWNYFQMDTTGDRIAAYGYFNAGII